MFAGSVGLIPPCGRPAPPPLASGRRAHRSSICGAVRPYGVWSHRVWPHRVVGPHRVVWRHRLVWRGHLVWPAFWPSRLVRRFAA